MFSSESLGLSVVPTKGKTLQQYLISSTCKKAPSKPPTVDDILSITDSAHIQDPRPVGFCSRLRTNLSSRMWADEKGIWETLRKDGYQTFAHPSAREHCGHTTCEEDCLFHTYKTTKVSEVTREGHALPESKQPRGVSSPNCKQQEFLWDSQMMNSPAEIRDQRDQQEDEQKRDILSEMDCSLRQLVDAEIEAFRVHLHSLLSEQHHQYRQILSPGDEPVKEQRMVYDNSLDRNDSYVWSPMNSADQPQIEESSGSCYSMQEDEASELYHANNVYEETVNSVLVQLLTSAGQVSHALRRHEYAS